MRHASHRLARAGFLALVLVLVTADVAPVLAQEAPPSSDTAPLSATPSTHPRRTGQPVTTAPPESAPVPEETASQATPRGGHQEGRGDARSSPIAYDRASMLEHPDRKWLSFRRRRPVSVPSPRPAVPHTLGKRKLGGPVMLNPQPLPPREDVMLNPQPLPPRERTLKEAIRAPIWNPPSLR